MVDITYIFDQSSHIYIYIYIYIYIIYIYIYIHIYISDAASLQQLLDNQNEILRMLQTRSVRGNFDDPEKDPEKVVRARLDGPCVTLEAEIGSRGNR